MFIASMLKTGKIGPQILRSARESSKSNDQKSLGKWN